MKTQMMYILALLWQIYKLIKIKNSLRWCKQIINQIQSLEVLSILGLKQKIKSGLYNIGDNTLCKGKLIASQTMRSLLDPLKYVAYSQLVMDKVFQIGQNRNTVHKNIRKLYSGFLKLYENGKQFLNIYETMQSNLITSKVLTKTKSYRQKLFNFSWLVSIFLRSPTRVVSNVYKQSYIPSNSQNVVFGRVLQNKSGQLQFFRPIAIASSKQKMIMFYKQQLDNFTFLWYLFIFVIIITIFIIIKYLISSHFLRKIILIKKQSQLNHIDRIYVKDLNCKKCQKALSSIITNPCWHLSICSQCNKGQHNCIQCDKKPKQSIIIYPC